MVFKPTSRRCNIQT